MALLRTMSILTSSMISLKITIFQAKGGGGPELTKLSIKRCHLRLMYNNQQWERRKDRPIFTTNNQMIEPFMNKFKVRKTKKWDKYNKMIYNLSPTLKKRSILATIGTKAKRKKKNITEPRREESIGKLNKSIFSV